MYDIKEFSKMTNLSSSTLRYYEDLGLLKNVQRDKNGLRLYDDCHLGRVSSIACFKECGVSLSRIQDFCFYEENTPEHIDDILLLLRQEEENLDNKILSMQHQLAHMRQKVRYFTGIKHALKENLPMPKFDDFKEE